MGRVADEVDQPVFALRPCGAALFPHGYTLGHSLHVFPRRDDPRILGQFAKVKVRGVHCFGPGLHEERQTHDTPGTPRSKVAGQKTQCVPAIPEVIDEHHYLTLYLQCAFLHNSGRWSALVGTCIERYPDAAKRDVGC